MNTHAHAHTKRIHAINIESIILNVQQIQMYTQNTAGESQFKILLLKKITFWWDVFSPIHIRLILADGAKRAFEEKNDDKVPYRQEMLILYTKP